MTVFKVLNMKVAYNKNKIHLILFIFAASLIIGSICFFVGSKYAEYLNGKNDTSSEGRNDYNKQISREDAIELYDTIPSLDGYINVNLAYQSKKVEFDDIQLNDLGAFIFSNISFSDGDLRPVMVGGECILDCEASFDELVSEGGYQFDARLLKSKAKELFNKEVLPKKFNDQLGGELIYNTEEETYWRGMDESDEVYTKVYREFSDYEVDGDYLYIYDKYMFIYAETVDKKGSSYNVFVYTESDKVNKVAEIKKIKKVTDAEYLDSLKNKYQDKAQSYKHTFKRISNNWYWVSSEPVK